MKKFLINIWEYPQKNTQFLLTINHLHSASNRSNSSSRRPGPTQASSIKHRALNSKPLLSFNGASVNFSPLYTARFQHAMPIICIRYNTVITMRKNRIIKSIRYLTCTTTQLNPNLIQGDVFHYQHIYEEWSTFSISRDPGVYYNTGVQVHLRTWFLLEWHTPERSVLPDAYKRCSAPRRG